MKRFAMILVLCLLFSGTSFAETSPTDDFLTNLSNTWNSFLVMTGEAASNVSAWAEESGVTAFLDETGKSIAAWADESGVSGFLSEAQQSISQWADESGFNEWAQNVSAETQALIEKNRPAVEAWLAQAGEDVRGAWDTLVNAQSHTQEEVTEALETVSEALDDDDDGGAIAYMANPWEDMTAEQLRAASGLSFVAPEGARDVVYRWLGSEKLAEMQFAWEGDEFCFRAQPAVPVDGELTDISGMYFEWKNTEDIAVGECAGTIAQAQDGSEGWVERCLWYDADAKITYSLSVTTVDPDGLDLTAMAEQICS